MLIKRNVYFSAIDEDGEERLYSTTEVMDEQDYIERLYAEAEEETKKNYGGLKAAGIGVGTTIGLGGAAVGGIKGAEVLAKRMEKARTSEEHLKKAIEKAKKNDKALKQARQRFQESVGTKLETNARGIMDAEEKRIGEQVRKRLEKAGKLEAGLAKVAEKGGKALNWANQHRVAAGSAALGTLALGGGIGYGVHKLRNRKKEN